MLVLYIFCVGVLNLYIELGYTGFGHMLVWLVVRFLTIVTGYAFEG